MKWLNGEAPSERAGYYIRRNSKNRIVKQEMLMWVWRTIGR